VSVSLLSALLSAQGQVLDVQPGAFSLSLGVANLLAQGQAITISAPSGVVVVNLNSALLSTVGQTLSVVPGAVIVSLDVALLSAIGQVIAIQTAGGIIVVLFKGMYKGMRRRMS